MKQRAHPKQHSGIAAQHKRLFRFTALLIPILFFTLLEFSLRLFHYGSDLSLFIAETVNGKSYYTLNPSLKNRYFSGINFAPNPSPEFFLASKPPGAFRIFCLGESSTIGYPYWYNGAFPSFLRDRLKAVFPDRLIEVINLGITATNSYTVLDLSKDVMEYKPDLLIVYDGHNEFYGMLGTASNERVASARWITLLYLRMIHLRTFQLAKNTLDIMLTVLGKPQIDYANHTTLMEHVARGKNIPYGSDAYNAGYTVFRENLEELSDLCRSRNIPLFLSTQASNIRDQSPFVSNNSAGISPQQLEQFQQEYHQGMEFQSKGMLDSAVVCFRAGIAVDSLYADIHYRLARCLDVQGKRNEAFPEYIRARDYDELRFRTDSKFNDLIRSMGDHKDVFVADIGAVFESLSQDSLVGHNLILEHLHPNTRGHFYIAKEYARQMRAHGLLASSEGWEKCDTVSDDFLWAHRHVTDLDEILAARKTVYLTSFWPFSDQPSAIASVSETDTLKFIAEQFAHNQIDWATAHGRAIAFYLRRGDTVDAVHENETIIDQFPMDVASYLQLAQLYFNEKEFPKAETTLLAALRIQQVPLTYRILGDTYLKEDKLEKAIQCYEELNKFPANPDIAAENAYMLAVAYLLSGKTGSAVELLKLTIDRYPDYRPARELLSRVMALSRPRPAK
ncbi:MAG TPA: tetratricopeptide repeat protein [Bacteroidota bacterium]|nr:tetratricopeptide repeat protein [Bacteroidota bacterium]